MENPATAQDLAARAARLRKYNVSFIMATQRPEDFGANRYTEKVLQQAETILIFGQKAIAADTVAGLFKLSPTEVSALTTARKGEFLLVAKNARILLKKHVAPERATLYSTSPTKDKHQLLKEQA